jgi:hypothetical protein
MRINTETIRKLNPCRSRFENWEKHYATFKGTLKQFFALSEITHADKLWITLRLLPEFGREVFAIDCGFAAAAAAADAAAAAAAADAYAAAAAAVDAADAYAAAAAAVDAADAERERQLEALLYLSKLPKKEGVR